MFRTRSMSTLAVIAALAGASLVHAQTGATPTESPMKQSATTTEAKATSAQPSEGQTSQAQASKTSAKAKSYGSKHVAKVDLNSASREELMKLPGINTETADKIIAARPFKSKSALLSKKLVSRKEYGSIAGRVMVKHEPMTASNTHK